MKMNERYHCLFSPTSWVILKQLDPSPSRSIVAMGLIVNYSLSFLHNFSNPNRTIDVVVKKFKMQNFAHIIFKVI